jgi:isoleucyl-tRNA synthetase
VVVLDTGLSPELVAEGDARELARAIQELRREAGLALDDRIDLWVAGLPPAVAAHLPSVATDTLAAIASGDLPSQVLTAVVELDGGPVTIALRRRAAAGSGR